MNLSQAFARIRKERAENIALRRGETTLAAQEMRIERLSKGSAYRSDAARERRSDVVILAEMLADIHIDDRFTLDGLIYRVNFIEPNRSVATIAEAVVIA